MLKYGLSNLDSAPHVRLRADQHGVTEILRLDSIERQGHRELTEHQHWSVGLAEHEYAAGTCGLEAEVRTVGRPPEP